MLLPKENEQFSWGNLWADLLKGAGRGLLEYDGSRAAQAALAGLEVFDAAQERRRQPGRQVPGGMLEDTLLKLWSGMSPTERAAFRRLPPEERNAYAQEWAEGQSDSTPQVGYGSPASVGARPPIAAKPLPYQGRPISINPLDGWHLQSVLPFGSDGRLNLPTYRR